MNLLRVWLIRGSGWAYRCDNHGDPLPPIVIGHGSAAEAGDAARRHFEREHVLIPPDPEETTTKLLTHYGPTDTNPDPGVEYHEGCGGEVYSFKEGRICAKCEQGEDPPASSVVMVHMVMRSAVGRDEQTISLMPGLTHRFPIGMLTHEIDIRLV